MVTSRILDQHGRPIEYDQLTEELAAPKLAGIRNIWNPSVASRLTPGRLAGVLQGAMEGNAHDYLTLAEEMEDRDLHYASVLSTRKLAASGLDVIVSAASDDAADVKLADAVREVVRTPEFGEMLADIVDALGKGYAVSEIMWDRSGKTWTPMQYLERDQRWFKFDIVTGRELRLIDEANLVDGLPLAPYKFIVHYPRIKSGLPMRGGLARLAAVAYMCKAWTWKDWMAFADIYGLPMRTGRYGPGASKDDIATLMAAVSNLGSDAAAVIPDSMKIEFTQAAQTAGAGQFFQGLAEWWDKQVSKGVIGQTMTADDGSSRAQADVHQLVREDLLQADAKALSNTLNRALVRPFIDLNFGPGRYPTLTVAVPKREDRKLLVDALDILVPLGLKVEQSVVRDKFGLPEPAAGADVLTAPAGPLPKPLIGLQGAVNSEQPIAADAVRTTAPDRVDNFTDQLNRQLGPVSDQWLQQIRELVDNATDLDHLQDSMLALFQDMNLDDFARGMGDAMSAAYASGRYDLLQAVGVV